MASSNLLSFELGLAEPLENGTIILTIMDSNTHLCDMSTVEKDGEREADSAVTLLRTRVKLFSECDTLIFGKLNTGGKRVSEENIPQVCAGTVTASSLDLMLI